MRYLLLVGFSLTLILSGRAAAQPIDRHALVTRHNPVVSRVDVDAPLTVGNGGFAFGCDITGLQTFAAEYQASGIPVEILSRWCWVSDPNPKGYTLADASTPFTLPDGSVQLLPTKGSSPAGDWLRKNPRNHPLGQLALTWTKPDGSPFTSADIHAPAQTLDLWRGVVTSRFQLGGEAVEVITACDPASDTVAVRVTSRLVANGQLGLRLAFPRGHDLAVKNTPGLDWSQPESHRSTLRDPQHVDRLVSETAYVVQTNRALTEQAPHVFAVRGDAGQPTLDFTLTFAPAEKPAAPGVDAILAASAQHWSTFWQEGAAVDFAGSTNPLAAKLEERIVLSQYLMAVQMAGAVPPQETGLTCSSWYGKHHSEMIWWHTAQFALWGHEALLAKNLEWYQAQLPLARELAHTRGLTGARWAKMTGPVMRESPGGNPLIIWNQPHLVYLGELLYRAHPTAETLGRYRELVLETATAMASMLHWEADKARFSLGPPLWTVQEIHNQATSQNPCFELSYWRWALGVAQVWRERLGLPRDPDWDNKIAHLAALPERDGKYVALESEPDTWVNIESRHDHPSMLMTLGVLPEAPIIDRATMGRTLDAVLATWDWETKIWGWDYPMIAMNATRLGRPEAAVEILLRDGANNRYLPTGHCPQRSDVALSRTNAPVGTPRREIAVYLPANGAFLSAVALMVAGWDGCEQDAPGIPKDGSWHVRHEGLRRLP